METEYAEASSDASAVLTQQFDDYWGFAVTRKWYLPDGAQFFEFEIMNEGKKAKYQRSTSKDIKINSKTKDASIRPDAAEERHELIKNSVVNWNLRRGGQIVQFSKQMVQNWLEVADPRLVEKLEFEIRKANPWLQGDMTIEDIQEEIARLEEMERVIRKEEEGKATS